MLKHKFSKEIIGYIYKKARNVKPAKIHLHHGLFARKFCRSLSNFLSHSPILFFSNLSVLKKISVKIIQPNVFSNDLFAPFCAQLILHSLAPFFNNITPDKNEFKHHSSLLYNTVHKHKISSFFCIISRFFQLFFHKKIALCSSGFIFSNN